MSEIIVPIAPVASDPTTAIIIALFLAVIGLLVVIARRAAPLSSNMASSQLSAIETRLSAVEQKVNTTEQSMHVLERAIGSLPTQQSVHELEKKVIELSGDMKAMAQESRSTAAGVGRIEDFLMKASADAIVANRSTNDGSQAR